MFLLDYEEFDESPYDDDVNEGEMIPLNNRDDFPKFNGEAEDEIDGIDRGQIPRGYFPQPNHYNPEVFLIHNSA